MNPTAPKPVEQPEEEDMRLKPPEPPPHIQPQKAVVPSDDNPYAPPIQPTVTSEPQPHTPISETAPTRMTYPPPDYESPLQGRDITPIPTPQIIGDQPMPPKEFPPEERQPVNPYDILGQLPGAPKLEHVEAWKRDYGKIYFFPFDETEGFIIRRLWRREWKDIQASAFKQSEGDPIVHGDLIAELICERCVLWPNLGTGWGSHSAAGYADTLAELIRLVSGFMPVQLAQEMVFKL
jgi:hypothetical protein